METTPTVKTGVKFDGGKQRFDLLPPYSLHELVKVLTYGANKYSPDNWKRVDDAVNRYFAASQRHLWAWRQGELKDPETGVSHLAHACASLFFILELTENTTNETITTNSETAS